MNRRTMGVGVGVAAIVLVGWLYAGRVATHHARRTIDDLLANTGLANTITYQDLSASPFGTVQLNHVSIANPGAEPTTIGTLVLSGIRQDEGIIAHVHMEAENAKIPLTGLMRASSAFGTPVGPARTLLGVGIDILQGTMTIDYAYDDDALSFSTSGRLETIGHWTMSTRLVRVDRQWIAAAGTLFSAGGESNWLPTIVTLASLPAPQLQKLSWRIDDAPLQDRLDAVPDTAMPPHDGATNVRNEQSSIADALIRNGVPASDARDDAEALDRWQRKGGALSFSTDIESPLPLVASNGLIGVQPAFPNFETFVARSHGSFSD